MLQVERTIASQFDNSATLVQLIRNWNGYLDPRATISAFVANVMNLDTAVGYGLDVLGRIVGVNRVLHVAQGDFWGFNQAGDAEPFDVAPFYNGSPTTSNYALADSAYRTLIQAKAMANICDGSVASINAILRALFPGRGSCYVTDPGNMTMTFTFTFALTLVEQAIVENSGVLPKPAGVQVNYSIPAS